MPKRYSSTEENVVLSSQLYLLESQAQINSVLIPTIGDLLPGVVLINDVAKLENTYMNKTGCDFLDKAQEELTTMGSAYFVSEHFCAEEMIWIKQHFGALAQRNDLNEVTGFYQRVRRNKNTDWKQYYLSGKILKDKPNCFIYLGLEINDRKKSIQSISKALDIEPISPITFERFNALSKREKEVLSLIVQGFTSKQISDQLFISQFTIETHRKNIHTKLGTKKLSDLIRIANLFNL